MMKPWRTTGIAAETLVALASLTCCGAAILALDVTPLDDRYISVLNGVIAGLLSGVVGHRFVQGSGDGLGRTGWLIAGIALALFAVMQLFEGRLEAVAYGRYLEDVDDVALLLVLPPAILIAGRAERIGRHAMQLVAVAVIAQVAAIVIDLLEATLARTETLTVRETEVLVDLSEFVFLQIYLIGLAVAAKRRPVDARPLRTAVPAGVPGRVPGGPEISWLKRQGLTPKRFYAWHVEPLLWRLRHPDRSPEDYYASRIQRQIRRGRFHPAIGGTARTIRAPSELLDILLPHGLQPGHTVVDYGCGSFRLGAAVIEYLEPGKYWGLDVVDDFMTMGMELLDPALVARRPNAYAINAESLARAREAGPDFVVSWHVCSKVPPHRLGDYFGKMISLMGPQTLLLVHFPEAARRRRLSRFSWAQTREAIVDVIHGIDPGLEIEFALVTDRVERGVRQSMVKVRRRG